MSKAATVSVHNMNTQPVAGFAHRDGNQRSVNARAQGYYKAQWLLAPLNQEI